MPRQATSDDVYRWLVGGDPRMVAWGAHFTLENRYTAMVPYLRQLAEEWVPLPPRDDGNGQYRQRSDEEWSRQMEMEAVLDALIQMHAAVAPGAIERLMPDFRDQALTLFALMPEQEREAYAENLYASRWPAGDYFAYRQEMIDGSMRYHPVVPAFKNVQEQRQRGDLLRVAAAILALKPPAGFVASLIDETTVELEVAAGGTDAYHGLGFGSACGDGFAIVDPKDWPQIWSYVVEQMETSRLQPQNEVIVPGNIALTTRRDRTQSSCAYMWPLTSTVRVQLLAQLLGVPNGKLGWGLAEYVELPYTDDQALRVGAQEAVDARERAFQATAAGLVEKGWMTPAEAESARPTLKVKIFDARESKTLPLQMMRLEGAKVVME